MGASSWGFESPLRHSRDLSRGAASQSGRRNMLRKRRRSEHRAERLVGFLFVAAEHLARAAYIRVDVAKGTAREREQRLAKPHPRIRHARAQCVAISAEPSVELPFREIAPVPINALIALEGIAHGACDDRSRTIIEGVSLRDQ